MTTATAPTPLLNAEPVSEHRSPAMEALRRLLKHRSAQAGLFLIGALILVAIFADLIAPYGFRDVFRDGKRFEEPCVHLLGCDRQRPSTSLAWMATAATCSRAWSTVHVCR